MAYRRSARDNLSRSRDRDREFEDRSWEGSSEAREEEWRRRDESLEEREGQWNREVGEARRRWEQGEDRVRQHWARANERDAQDRDREVPFGRRDVELREGRSGYGLGSPYDRDLGRDFGRDFGRDLGRDLGREVERERGRFAGVGPKGYRRSDDRIHDEICQLLTRDPYVDASDIDIRIENGEAVVEGKVRSREEKWRVENLVESIRGVNDVTNRLKVSREEHGSEAQRGGSHEQREGSQEKRGGSQPGQPRQRGQQEGQSG